MEDSSPSKFQCSNIQSTNFLCKPRKANDMKIVLKEEVNTEQHGFAENSSDVDSSRQHGNGQKYYGIRFTKETRTPSKNNAEMGDATPSITRKPAISSLKAPRYGIASKLRAPVTSNSKMSTARDSIVKRRSQLESFHKSLSSASSASEAKKHPPPFLIASEI